MPEITSGGGGIFPMEKTSYAAPVVKTPEITEDKTGEVCEMPQMHKKENLPYPTLTGIEEQLDQSFKDFKGSLKEARERASIISGEDKGDETGLKSSVIKGATQVINVSQQVNIEGSFVAHLSDADRRN